MLNSFSRVFKEYLKVRYSSVKNSAATLNNLYQNSSKIVSDFNRKQSYFKVMRHLSDAHFNVPAYYQSQLESQQNNKSILSAQDRKLIDEILMTMIGEAKLVRQTIDQTSQKMNHAFKQTVLIPASDAVLQAQSYIAPTSIISHTAESIRKELRFSLRRLSASNVLSPVESRIALANSHCVRIANEANKILKANIVNFCATNAETNDKEVADILSMIPPVDMNKSLDELLLSPLLIEEMRGKMSHMEDQQKVDAIFQIYENISKDVRWKIKLLHDEIALVQEIEKKFGSDKLYSQYVKIRVLYAAEWIARVMVLDIFSLPLVSTINNNLLENSGEVSRYSTNIFIKQVMTTAMGHLFNVSQKYRGNRSSGYLVGVDTEAHDYPKLILRIACLAILLHVQTQLGSDAGVDG